MIYTMTKTVSPTEPQIEPCLLIRSVLEPSPSPLKRLSSSFASFLGAVPTYPVCGEISWHYRPIGMEE